VTRETARESLKAIVLAILAALVLTGCIKARLEVEVTRDGSGTMSIALGMTEQVLSLAGTDGEGLMQMLSQEVSDDAGTEDATVRRWTEGNYEWVAATTTFVDLEDLNSRLADIEGFEGLSLTRKRGLIRDHYVLDGEIDPLVAGEEATEDLLLDPSGMFEFQMRAKLPGDVVETNGVFLGDSTQMLWTLGNYEPLSVHAVSRTWNWTRITLVVIGAGLAAGALLLLVVAMLMLSHRTHSGESSDDLIEESLH
jgi:hypothetical protein